MDFIIGGELSKQQKIFLVKKIYNITKEEAIDDFIKLKELSINDINNQKSYLGSKFINYFTSLERLNTISKKNINFFDFWENKTNIEKKRYFKNLLSYYKKKEDINIYKLFWRVFNLYYGSINIFRPIIAMNIYIRFRPKSILDFTMGWGGRLLGACALDIPYYIGIDINKNLKQPYNDMIKLLKNYSKTNIKIIFNDALKVDYSKLNYDLVLTSPPYYNIELYTGTKKKSIEEWNNNFYIPLFTNTYKYLQTNGYYCLNIPNNIYNNICIKLFGKSKYKIPLIKKSRNINNYEEYIYIWQKY